MAFMGIIPLYHSGGLMRLDFLISRSKGTARDIMVLLNKLFSLMLGVIMVITRSIRLSALASIRLLP